MDAENQPVHVARARPDALTEQQWFVVQDAADGKTAKMIANDTGLRKYQVDEILKLPAAAAMLVDLRRERSEQYRARMDMLTEDVLDYYAEVLADGKRPDELRIRVGESILDRVGLVRQQSVKVDANVTGTVQHIQGIELQPTDALLTALSALRQARAIPVAAEVIEPELADPVPPEGGSGDV